MEELFMTGREVGDFIRSFALGRANFKSTKDIIDELIEKMKSMKQAALDVERGFYKLYNVSGLSELQKLLDEANDDLKIRQLTNTGFRTTDWGEEILEGGVSTSEVIDRLDKAISKTVEKEGVDYESIVDGIARSMASYFKEGNSVRFGDNGGKNTLIRENILKKDLMDALTQGEDFSKTYARDLKTYLAQKTRVTVKNNFQEEIELTIPVGVPNKNKFPRQRPKRGITGFPYFNLTQEDKNYAAKSGTVSDFVWNGFKDFLSSGSPHADIIKNCMEQMGRTAFIEEGGSYAGVIGILGELQTMVFLSILSKGNPPHFTGHELNSKGKKVDIDILLGAYGFQVKNYKEYYGNEGMGHHIKGHYTWSQLEDRLGNDSAYDAIKQFYVTQAFNQPNYKYEDEPSFKNYASFYKNFLNQKGGSTNNAINAYLAGNLEKLIPLQNMMELSGIKSIDSSRNTVFWMLSGKTIISTSAICAALIERLEKFKLALKGGQKTGFSDFRVNTLNGSYPKDKIWDGQNSLPDGVTYDFVENTLGGLRFDFNIYLSDFKKYLDESYQ